MSRLDSHNLASRAIERCGMHFMWVTMPRNCRHILTGKPHTIVQLHSVRNLTINRREQLHRSHTQGHLDSSATNWSFDIRINLLSNGAVRTHVVQHTVAAKLS